MIHPIEQADLSGLNTFGFSSQAQYLVEVSSDEALREALHFAQANALPLLVIGGGSNLVLGPQIPGVVVRLTRTGFRCVSETDTHVVIEVEAGQNWHQLVEETVAAGWCGLENLALIPGTVGAAPIQNIGAYGVELKDRFHSLVALDTQTGDFVEMNAGQCEFGYRNSRFKHREPGRYIIVRVRLQLSKVFEPVLAYGGLGQQLEGKAVDAQTVMNTVIAVRRSKLPDPAVLGNAGSFFENPVIPQAQYEAVREQYPDLVAFADKPGHMKLAAGWLIDRAGWKGFRAGEVGVYDKQALVLVNYGGGNARQLMALAEQIQESVWERFGVRLVPEPRQYPADR